MTRECAVPGCDRPARLRGWCKGHYDRWWAYGDVMADKPLRRASRSLTGLCKVPGCDRKHSSRGWCGAHYRRWYDTGDVQAGRPIGRGWGNPNGLTRKPYPPAPHPLSQQHPARPIPSGP